ncbi:MAG: polysaccharide pyruvyl transferase family protein [Proteobacteria bacterium]|nr:polysaccharide pyruvyl transferase family protein [Pseudomonadota bacterium]
MSAAELEIGSGQRGKPPDVGAVRVALFGGFGIGNFGNDASLEATADYLRAEYPHIVLCSICSAPQAAADKFGLPTYATGGAPSGLLRLVDIALLRVPRTIWNWLYAFRILKRVDVMLVAGTGVFDDYRDSPFGWPSRLLRWSLAARLSGVRLVFLSVGAGPIVNPISRLLMKASARLAQHRSYRDADSRAFMQSIGMDESRSTVLPDLAFLLPSPEARRPAGAPLTVGVGVMNYRGWRDSDAAFDAYVAVHVRLIQWIEAKGYRARILIGQTPVDLKAVRAIEGRVGHTLMKPGDAELNSFQDAMAAAAETDVVVASRYHVQIAALKAGRPLISLSYAPKNDSLLAEAGLGEFVQPIEQVDFDRLTGQIETLLKERDRYSALVRARVADMEARLEGAIRDLDLLAPRG